MKVKTITKRVQDARKRLLDAAEKLEVPEALKKKLQTQSGPKLEREAQLVEAVAEVLEFVAKRKPAAEKAEKAK